MSASQLTKCADRSSGISQNSDLLVQYFSHNFISHKIDEVESISSFHNSKPSTNGCKLLSVIIIITLFVSYSVLMMKSVDENGTAAFTR